MVQRRRGEHRGTRAGPTWSRIDENARKCRGRLWRDREIVCAHVHALAGRAEEDAVGRDAATVGHDGQVGHRQRGLHRAKLREDGDDLEVGAAVVQDTLAVALLHAAGGRDGNIDVGKVLAPPEGGIEGAGNEVLGRGRCAVEGTDRDDRRARLEARIAGQPDARVRRVLRHIEGCVVEREVAGRLVGDEAQRVVRGHTVDDDNNLRRTGGREGITLDDVIIGSDCRVDALRAVDVDRKRRRETGQGDRAEMRASDIDQRGRGHERDVGRDVQQRRLGQRPERARQRRAVAIDHHLQVHHERDVLDLLPRAVDARARVARA
eukprot:m.158377 g.158377  ORF g.158377 m.158377 type:complete len:321 (+) comp9824_c0_seq1:1600-2562(+)